ncbi:MAG: ATP-binding protein [Pyrinomonadaceae bacterium]
MGKPIMNANLIRARKVAAAIRSWAGDWGGMLTIALGVFFLGYVFWIYFIQPSEDNKILVTDLAQPLITLAMTILAWRASRQKNLDIRKRRAWRILSAAFLTYFAGNVMWAYYELGLGLDLAVSWADVPYLMYYPICLVGLLTFPLGRAGRSRLTFSLDAGTVMLGAGILIWYFVLRPVAQAEHVSTLESFVTLAYPTGNTVLLFGVIAVLLRRPPVNVRRALRILTLAILFDAIADFGYSYQTLERTYFGGQWPDCFYMLAFVLMSFSAQSQIQSAKFGRSASPTTGPEKSPFSWLPYVAVGVVYGLLLIVAYDFQTHHGLAPIVWLIVGSFLITALVVARQIVALRENSHLLAEKAARESEARVAALVQHSSDVIAIIEANGDLVYVSPAVQNVFGYRAVELIGTRLREIINPDDQAHALEAISSIQEKPGATVSLELRIRHRDQRWIDVEATATNLLHEPTVAGIVLNSRDVTERKKAAEALRDSEERLRQSQKMEAVGQLAGGVAHDFNNLLAVIIGYADLTLRKLSPEGNERIIKQIEEIKKAGDRAKTLTRQLLAFSRKQVLQPEILDLNSVVKDMDKMLQRLIGEHIEVRAVLSPELGNVKADPGQVEQVLLNLVVNARDAMPDGGSITIETANVTHTAFPNSLQVIKPGPYVMVAVGDTGCGMTPEIKSRIFEPFFTTKEKGKGTGLGLSTVYGIVEQSGGNIFVYSEPGQGTAFKVYLPRVNEFVAGKEAVAPDTQPLTGTETVLLVEDEDAVRQMAQEILRLSGYKVLDANNGAAAVRVSEQHQGTIDLMLTDVVMPQIGGRELAERLSVTRPDMRVLYMSGYTDDAIVHHGVLDGRAAFLEKPFTPDALALKVREVLAVA